MLKPSLFIGSSSETYDKGIVADFRNALTEFADVIIWKSLPEFDTGNSTTDALVRAANEYDFALLILAKDDAIKDRDGSARMCPRDNVILELGLFLGAIGPDRAMAVIESGRELKLPTDIDGRNLRRFRTDNTAIQENDVREAARSIGEKIKEMGRREIEIVLAKEWHFNSESESWDVELGATRLERNRPIIGNRSLGIAVRIANKLIPVDQDKAIRFSDFQPLPRRIDDNMCFSLAASEFSEPPKADDWIQSFVLMIPEGTDITRYKTLQEIANIGGHKVDSMRYQIGS